MDAYSISLNAPTKERYEELTRPSFDNAFSAMLDFARDCKEAGKDVQFSVVTVISEEEIESCRKIAEEMGIHLKVRAFS